MLGILKRDLTLMLSSKQRVLLLFYIPLLLFIVESYVPEFMYFVILVAYTYLMSVIPFDYDITGKYKYIMNSLPISRLEVVLYKYITTFIYFAISIVYVGVYLWIINVLNLATVDYFNLEMILQAIPIIMIFTSIVFPVYFRFEPKIAQIVQMIIFISFFITVANISSVGEKALLNQIGFLKYINIPLVAVVMYILSLLLSIKLYKNRDL